MSQRFYIKRGDSAPPIRSQLRDALGAVVNLTNTSVKLVIESVLDADATVTDALEGRVEYQWQPGNTATVGTYKAEWQVTFIDGSIETFPNRGYLSVEIGQDLGD